MLKLGLDIGNSAVKGTLLDGNNSIIAELDYPSVVAHVNDAKYLTYTSDDDIYFQIGTSALEHSKLITAVGNKALNLPNALEFDVTSSSHKANSELATALLFGGLVPYLNQNEEVILALSIPIVEAKTVGLAAEYKKLLEGTHSLIIFNEDESKNKVIQVTIKTAMILNEGQAGFLGMLDTVDKQFRSTLNELYLALGEESDPIGDFEDFLIVDIGEGTTDEAVFRDKKFNPDFSYSITKGYGNLLSEAIALGMREGLTMESRKDLQKVLSSTNKRRENRKLKWLNFVIPSKNAFIDTVVDTVMKAYGSKDYFDAIIFIGGGFTALTGYRIENGEIVMDDTLLFDTLNKKLEKLHKDAGLIFGIPKPYSQNINSRGLVQVLSTLN